MSELEDLAFEAQEALERIWFIQRIQFFDRTDDTISIRLFIRDDLFIQAFTGRLSNSLYFALIDGNQRIFGIDRESDEWHIHPFKSPHSHNPLSFKMEPKPLLKFLSIVENLLIEENLL